MADPAELVWDGPMVLSVVLGAETLIGFSWFRRAVRRAR
jgi:hypothetical protein